MDQPSAQQHSAAAATAALQAQPAKPKRVPSSYDEPTPEKIAFGKRMKEAREIAGISQADAAEAMGYSQAVQLSLMESGQRMPTVRVLIHCAVLYGTTLDYLCGLVEDSDRDPVAAIQREIAGRITSEVRQLIAHVTAGTVDAVRELHPDAERTARLAAEVLELSAALARVRESNSRAFEGLRAGALLVRRTEAAAQTASEHLAAVARAQRLAAASRADYTSRTGVDETAGGLAELTARLSRPLPLPADALVDDNEPDATGTTTGAQHPEIQHCQINAA